MKADEIRAKTSEQIRGDIQSTQEELMNLRFQREVGQLGDPSLPRTLRKDIARMMTILQERELTE